MKPVIAIVGPTGIGKSRLAIALAKTFGGEIISTDSMQFYKGLDIGTAKIKKEEMQGVSHHLIDILEPEEDFSVAEFQEMVRTEIAELHKKNILPILVGGSGLYIQSVLYDYKFKGEKRDEETSKSYQGYETWELAEILQEKNPKLARQVDLENRRRVLRALEKSDEDLDESGTELYYSDALIIGLETDRELLYQMIDERVDKMINDGLMYEAKKLYNKNLDTQATKAIGYKEFFEYFNEEISIEKAIEMIKRNTRRYAKRQFTWFKNKMDIEWFDVDINDFDKTVKDVSEFIKKKLN